MVKPQPTPIRDLAFAVKCLAEARREPYHRIGDNGSVGLTDSQRSMAGDVLDRALILLRDRLAALEAPDAP
jgi:hypothetical protein